MTDTPTPPTLSLPAHLASVAMVRSDATGPAPRRGPWTLRVVWVAALALTALGAALGGSLLGTMFPAVGPRAAFTGVSVVALIVALLAVGPMLSAQLQSMRGAGMRVLLRTAGAEIAVLLALAAPFAVAGWKHAPHSAEALLGVGVLLLGSLLAAAAWAIADAVYAGRAGRHVAFVTSLALTSPLLAYALWDFAGRQPWWLLALNPPWLVVDSAPPKLGLLSAPFFWPSLSVLVGAAAAGLGVAAWGARRWSWAAAAVLGAIGLPAGIIALTLAEPQPRPSPSTPASPIASSTSNASGTANANSNADGARSAATWQIPSLSGPEFYWLANVDSDGARPITAVAPPVAIENPATQAGTTPYPMLALPNAAVAEFSSLGPTPRPARLPFAPSLPAQSDGFAAAVLANRQSSSLFEFRGAGQALVPITPAQMPEHPALWRPFSAVVLATLERSECTDAALAAVADWVRGGGVLVWTGFPNSDGLWHQWLAQLGLTEPPRRLSTTLAAGGPWRVRSIPSGESAPITWAETDAGAGLVVRLALPTQSPNAAAVLIRHWLAKRLSAGLDPLRSIETEAGGRLLAAKFFVPILRDPDESPVPAGSLPWAVAGAGLALVVAMAGVAGYGVGEAWSRAVLVAVAASLGGGMALALSQRDVDLIEAPIWVSRAGLADAGPCREVRFVVATAAKDVANGVTIGVPRDHEVLPNANSAAELLSMPWRVRWPYGPAAAADAPIEIHFERWRSGDYRLFRTDALTEQPPGVTLEAGRRLWVGAATRLMAVVEVRAFELRVLAPMIEAGDIDLSTTDGFAPYRPMLTALEGGTLFADLRDTVQPREWRVMAAALQAAVRADQHFVAALVATAPVSRVTVNGSATVLRPVLLIPLPAER